MAKRKPPPDNTTEPPPDAAPVHVEPRCHVCTRLSAEDRVAAELAALTRTQTLRAIGDTYGVSADSIRRHMSGGHATSTAIAQHMDSARLTVSVVDEHLANLVESLNGRLSRGWSEKDASTLAGLLTRLRGQLTPTHVEVSGSVTVDVGSVVLRDHEVDRLLDGLSDALAHPDVTPEVRGRVLGAVAAIVAPPPLELVDAIDVESLDDDIDDDSEDTTTALETPQ